MNDEQEKASRDLMYSTIKKEYIMLLQKYEKTKDSDTLHLINFNENIIKKHLLWVSNFYYPDFAIIKGFCGPFTSQYPGVLVKKFIRNQQFYFDELTSSYKKLGYKTAEERTFVIAGWASAIIDSMENKSQGEHIRSMESLLQKESPTAMQPDPHKTGKNGSIEISTPAMNRD